MALVIAHAKTSAAVIPIPNAEATPLVTEEVARTVTAAAAVTAAETRNTIANVRAKAETAPSEQQWQMKRQEL